MSDRRDLLSAADHVALDSLHAVLLEARRSGDRRASFALIADCLEELGVALPERKTPQVPLAQAREEWLSRLRSANRSTSTLAGYRVAIDDLISYLNSSADALSEQTIVAYLEDYRRRAQPAAATYYRRFILLRRFFRWLSARAGVRDPFLDLEPPPKPQVEADWLTPEEFGLLLAAAGSPQRKRRGLAERDQLVLIALVATGLRRSELLNLDWRDLDLEGERPSLLVRRGKGGKPRRQPLLPELAARLAENRALLQPQPGDPVFCGLEGKRLQAGILAQIIRRAATRAELAKHVSAHTLRHSAATWLRQQTGDARLVAAYLGHSDLSTVSRYAHVAEADLHQAAEAIGRSGTLAAALGQSAGGLSVPDGAASLGCAGRSDAGTAFGRKAGRPRRAVPVKPPRMRRHAPTMTVSPANGP
jgi:site-specific recombinase XerD